MGDKQAAERGVIQEVLALLGYDRGDITSVESLHGGSSGSMVYRLWTNTEQFVLKTTAPASADYIRTHAQREISFYTQLAPRLAVPTPRILASAALSGQTALLLAAYEPSEPAPRWQHNDYVEIAEQLAHFHSQFWDTTHTLAPYSWLQSHDHSDEPNLDTIRAAWKPLRGRLAVLGVDDANVDAMLDHGVRFLAAIAKQTTTFPTTLCHGDFHSANLLRDAEGCFMWADWQEVGKGYGPRDLSFFVQRAMTDGGDVPEDILVEVYHARLCALIGVDISRAALVQVMDAFELGTRLLHWPAYLVGAPDATIATHLARIEQILTRTDN